MIHNKITYKYINGELDRDWMSDNYNCKTCLYKYLHPDENACKYCIRDHTIRLDHVGNHFIYCPCELEQLYYGNWTPSKTNIK